MIEYWNELTQVSQVAIIVAAITAIAGVFAVLIRSFLKIGFLLVIVGLLASSGLLGFDWFSFNQEAPPVNAKTGREKAPLFTKIAKEKKPFQKMREARKARKESKN